MEKETLEMFQTILAGIEGMEKRFDVKLEAMEQRLDGKMIAMEQRFDVKLEAMEQRFDAKMEAMEQRLDAKMEAMEQRLDVKMEAMEQRLDVKMDTKLAATRREVMEGFSAVIEQKVSKEIRLIAEQHGEIVKKLERLDQIDDLEDRVGTLEFVARKHTEELRELRKAE